MSISNLRSTIERRKLASLGKADRLSDVIHPTRGQAIAFEGHLSDIRRADAVLDAIDRPPRVTVRSEPTTYRKGGTNSYFRDLSLTQIAPGVDPEASDRLARHAEEVRVESANRRAIAERRFAEGLDAMRGTAETRADMGRTVGAGAEFAPPGWLIDEFVAAPTAGRVLAALARQLPLPSAVSSISIPRLTAGPVSAASVDLAAVPSSFVSSSAATSPVVTLAGAVDISLAALEQSAPPGLDAVVWSALEASYAASLEAQVLSGTGSAGQLLGLRNVVGIVAQPYVDAAPTTGAMFTAIMQGASKLATGRQKPATCALIHPRRWYWAQSPVETPPGLGYLSTGADDAPAGPIGSIAAYLDASIPTNLGAGTEDVVILTRPSDHLLFEGEANLRITMAQGADTLTARVGLHRYCAWLPGLYPSATAVVSGTGFASPAGY